MEQLRRLRWELTILVFTVIMAWWFQISRENVETVFYKFLVFCPSVVLVHLSRRALFPYIDISAAIYGEGDWADAPVAVRAVCIGGILLYYPLLIKALTEVV